MPGRGAKSKGQETDRKVGAGAPDEAERKARQRGADLMDLPVEDPDPEAQPDGDPGREDKKIAGSS